jgi:hypothetical protein
MTEKTCYIHAGTHKTASTYIQSRLIRNRTLLARQGVIYTYPGKHSLRHKPLASATKSCQWDIWNRYLDSVDRKAGHLLISAEQFGRLFCRRRILDDIIHLLGERGYHLHVLVFIRPQLEYMNSMYAYTLRRFYHDDLFENFVHRQLSTPPKDSFYHYNAMFRPLLNSSASSTFLPFSKSYGDPYLQLLQGLKLDVSLPYKSAASGTENEQAGVKGVWLSRLVFQRLQSLGFNGKMLKSAAKVVVRTARENGWLNERYYGFTDELAQQTQDYFRPGNHKFSKRAWNKSWEDVFPPKPLPPRSVYSPTSPMEDTEMSMLADRCLAQLAAKNPALAKAVKLAKVSSSCS